MADPKEAPGTLLDNPTEADSGKSTSGVEWRTDLPEDLREHKSLSKFDSVAALAKGYVNAESRMGNSARIPSEESSPEDWAAFYKKVGRPDKAQEYQLAGRDKAPEEDAEFFANLSLENNLTKPQAQKMWEKIADVTAVRIQQAQDQLVADREGKRRALQEKWGDDFHAKAHLATKVAKRFGGDELMSLMRRTRLGDEPEVLEAFAAVGAVLSEDVLEGGTVKAPEKPKESTAKDMYPNSPKLK